MYICDYIQNHPQWWIQQYQLTASVQPATSSTGQETKSVRRESRKPTSCSHCVNLVTGQPTTEWCGITSSWDGDSSRNQGPPKWTLQYFCQLVFQCWHLPMYSSVKKNDEKKHLHQGHQRSGSKYFPVSFPDYKCKLPKSNVVNPIINHPHYQKCATKSSPMVSGRCIETNKISLLGIAGFISEMGAYKRITQICVCCIILQVSPGCKFNSLWNTYKTYPLIFISHIT